MDKVFAKSKFGKLLLDERDLSKVVRDKIKSNKGNDINYNINISYAKLCIDAVGINLDKIHAALESNTTDFVKLNKTIDNMLELLKKTKSIVDTL